jgi:hypothetical protein
VITFLFGRPCDPSHIRRQLAALRLRQRRKEGLCMHGLHPSIKTRRWSAEWNFGMVAMVLLAMLAIVALLIAPEVYTQ